MNSLRPVYAGFMAGDVPLQVEVAYVHHDLSSLCIAGEGFLLYCLYHFRQELKKPSACECDVWTVAAPARFRSQSVDLQARLAPVRNAQGCRTQTRCLVRRLRRKAAGSQPERARLNFNLPATLWQHSPRSHPPFEFNDQCLRSVRSPGNRPLHSNQSTRWANLQF